MGCRDCKRCTERGVVGATLGIPRLLYTVTIGWIVNLFQKKCPQCGHPMRWHAMVGGRFQD